jgi:hypothetical protein
MRGAPAWGRGLCVFLLSIKDEGSVSMGPPVGHGHAVDIFRVGGELNMSAALSLHKFMPFCFSL